MRAAAALIPALLLTLWACSPAEQVYQWNLPAGFPVPDVPADNPMSNAKVALGRALFYDTKLSANQGQACASCHQQAFAFAQPSAVAVGSTGQLHRRNSPALVNVAYLSNLTWANPKLTRLEQQLLIPLFGEHPVELGLNSHDEEVLARFAGQDYAPLFKAAFGDAEVTFVRIINALASFVRSLVSFDSPFDRYAYQMQDNALSESAKRGMALFFSEQLECHHCHGGFNFSQSSRHAEQALLIQPFHNTGLYNEDGKGAYPKSDQGLYEVTGRSTDMGLFRAPTLRNVARSAPYMHDGSVATLSEVIDLYAAGGRTSGRQNPHKSVFVKGFSLSQEQKQDLLAFLHSLTDEGFLNNPDHGQP
ncbi:MbnH family di-heme enzyme [Bowmanella pacifica]|uniref:Di-heme enzyme n=1 Tax=Bowmanella pacifica TaxID=502051 RepID=A0A918DJ55_9ALTE|nr:di-heme enzyme [Bowmanella pacifica]